MASTSSTNEPPFPRYTRSNIEQVKSRFQKITLSEGVDLKYRKSTWKPVAGTGEVSYAEFFCAVVVDGRKSGVLCASLYRINTPISNNTFIDIMDDESAEAYDLAVSLCEKWDELYFQVMLSGPILELYAAYLDRSLSSRISLKTIIDALRKRVLTNYSVVVVQAVPFPPSTAEPEAPPARDQGALKRHYTKTFGLKSFPGSAGESGWMWAPNPRGTIALDIDPGRD